MSTKSCLERGLEILVVNGSKTLAMARKKFSEFLESHEDRLILADYEHQLTMWRGAQFAEKNAEPVDLEEEVLEPDYVDPDYHHKEKTRRRKRIETNADLAKNKVVRGRQHNKRQTDSIPLELRVHPNTKKQPRYDRRRDYKPKPQAYSRTIETDPVFHSVRIPIKVTPEIAHAFRRPEVKISLSDERLQPFLFFLEAMPDAAIRVLKDEGLLKENNPRKDYLFKIDFSQYYGYWANEGNLGLDWEVTDAIGYKGESFKINEDVAQRLYQACVTKPVARKRLRMFGIYTFEMQKVLETVDPVESLSGLSDVCDDSDHETCASESGSEIPVVKKIRALGSISDLLEGSEADDLPRVTFTPNPDSAEDSFEYQDPDFVDADWRQAAIDFHNKRKNRELKPETQLRKRDLRGNKKGRRSKKPHSHSGIAGMNQTVYMKKAPKDDDSRKVGKREAAYGIPEHHRFISDPVSLYKACAYIVGKRAKQQKFEVPVEMINEPVKIILRYVQSRVDRSLYVNIDEILSLENEVVNYRLSKWETETNFGLTSVNHMFGGRFYDYKKGQKSKRGERVEVVGTNVNGGVIHISKSYQSQPDRYVTTPQELLSAVRRVLSGRIGLDHFNVLDPRTRSILSYCSENREVLAGAVHPKDIASAKLPELRTRLHRENLLNAQFYFVDTPNFAGAKQNCRKAI
jgi:hypothetical protein